ncbi:hypothetical protein EJB05_31294, partial [Eragrostis curvula]
TRQNLDASLVLSLPHARVRVAEPAVRSLPPADTDHPTLPSSPSTTAFAAPASSPARTAPLRPALPASPQTPSGLNLHALPSAAPTSPPSPPLRRRPDPSLPDANRSWKIVCRLLIMLQWMGGSRRKVYASRKSTQSSVSSVSNQMLGRQRQYFEQKKRQQQQNQNDVAGGQASHDKEPRSLDVLNINNLATPNSHPPNEPADAEGAIPQLNVTLSDASPTEALKKITSLCNSNTNEAGSQPRLSSTFGHQDVAAAVNSHEQLGCKISPSINYSTKRQIQNLGLDGEISLIDLACYEGSKNKPTARPAREAHVSFSVKGLGHIKMETPPHTPRPIKRDLPLPPKAMRFTHKAKRSIPFDVTKALDSMRASINMLNERRPPDKIGNILDESDYLRRKQSNCYFPDSFNNHNADLYFEDEDMFYETRAEKDLQSKRSRSDGNLVDENSDRLWRIDQFNSKDHFPISREEHFDSVDYGSKDRYSPERRNPTRSSTRFDNTGIPSSHDLFSDHSLMDDDKGTELFEWERHPKSKKISNSNSTFGPSAWPFDMGDDSEKRRSPISEESCSSAAGMKDRSCKKPSPSVKNEMNKKDEFHMSLDELGIPNMDAHLNGMSLFNNPEKMDSKRTTDQKKLGTGYWPERTTEQTREPSCRISLSEKFSSWGSPTSHSKNSTGLSTEMHEDKPFFKSGPDMSSYQTVETTEKIPASKVHSVHEDKPFFMSGPDMSSYQTVEITEKRPAPKVHSVLEDKPFFKSGPDMSSYQTVETTEKRPGSKVHSVFHGSDNAIFENGINMQHPVSDIFGDKMEMSNPFRPKDIQSDIDMGTFFGQKLDKRQEDNFATLSNRNTDIYLAKKAESSVRQTVGRHSTCSQPSGTDSFRHGSNPGFSFQESKPSTFWEDTHVTNGTFQRDLSGLLARENSDKNDGKIKASAKPDNKTFAKTFQLSADHRNEMSGTETCSDGSEVSNYPEVRKDTSAATKQIPANLNCLGETSAELFQSHAYVRPVTREQLDDPGIDYEAPSHLRNKFHNVGDQSEINAMFQSPFLGEVGVEKKIIASVSPNNSDVQYQFMLEQRVLRRLCVQKIVVPTPMMDKLDKDKRFRVSEDGSHILAKSV